MNNSIWKVLTALGVAGIGVFFVIQVQGRLAAQKKNDPQAALAATESAAADAPAAGSDQAAQSAGPAAAAAADGSPSAFEEPESGSEIRTASFQAGSADPPAGNSPAAAPDERFFSNLEEPAPAETAASETPALEPPAGAAPVADTLPAISAPPATSTPPAASAAP